MFLRSTRFQGGFVPSGRGRPGSVRNRFMALNLPLKAGNAILSFSCCPRHGQLVQCIDGCLETNAVCIERLGAMKDRKTVRCRMDRTWFGPEGGMDRNRWTAFGMGTKRSIFVFGVLLAAILCGAGSASADVLGAWAKTNSAKAPSNYVSQAVHPSLAEPATMNWRKRFYEYNDNSWFYIEPWINTNLATVVNGVTNFYIGGDNHMVDGIPASNQFTVISPITRKLVPITNYIEFTFAPRPGYRVVVTQMVHRMQNDERALKFDLRSSADDYSTRLFERTGYPVKMGTGLIVIQTNLDLQVTSNQFLSYTNVVSERSGSDGYDGAPLKLRLYGGAAKSKWVYAYWTNVSPHANPAYTNAMIVFEGRVDPLANVLPRSGPLAGGNFVLVTNAFDLSTSVIGNGVDITNVTLGGKSVLPLHGQGTNWVSFTAPPGDSPGKTDIRIYSISTGLAYLAQAYAYNPAGVIVEVAPTGGVAGIEVTIRGSNFCNAAGDVTNVLFGSSSVVPTSLSPTQIVATAPSGGGVTPIRIYSTSHGLTEKADGFTYNGPVGFPELKVLGTNGEVVASGSAAVAGAGNDFGGVLRGLGATNTFAITNAGLVELTVSGVTTSGTGAAYFRVVEWPATVAEGNAADFKIAFDATVAGTHAATVEIASDDGLSPFALNLSGATVAGRIGTASASGVATVGVFSAASTPNQPGPISLQYLHYHQQHVYSAARLAAAGVAGSAQITAAGFDVAQAATPHAVANYLVRMAETERTAWAWDDKTMQSAGLSEVYANAAARFAAGAAADLELDTAFYLRPDAALLVDCGFSRPGATVSMDGRVNVEMAAGAMVFATSDAADARQTFDAASNAATNLLPRMVLAWRTVADPGVSPLSSPSTGGVAVAISGVHLCNGTPGDVASVTLNGAAAEVLEVNGSTQIVVRAGAGGATGRGAVEVVSAQYGRTAVANLFTYHPAGAIASVAPAMGTDGTTVTIVGTNLCDGTLGDVTGVTLAGIAASVQSVNGSTQIVVQAGAGSPGLSGDVVVDSVLFGRTTASNAFAYAVPQMQVLGTNLAPIASGDAPAGSVGTYYGVWKVGQETTHTFAITNVGIVDVDITGVSTNE